MQLNGVRLDNINLNLVFNGNMISIKTSQSMAIECLVYAKDGGVSIRRCVLPFQLVGGMSHIHVGKIGNLQGAGLWRMAEDWNQRHA